VATEDEIERRAEREAQPVGTPRWIRAVIVYGVAVLIASAVVWVLTKLVGLLTPVVLAIAVALLMAALLQPLVRLLCRLKVPRSLAALLAVLAALLVVGGTLAIVAVAVTNEAPDIAKQTGEGVKEIRNWLVEGPLGLSQDQLDSLGKQAGERARALGPASLRGAATVLEILGSTLLALVLLFFLLKDGPLMWRFLLRAAPEHSRARADRAGLAGWQTLGGFTRGIVVVAAVDALGIGVGLLIIGVPLAIPLALLTFFASFVPVLGATAAGAVAVLVALAANGFTDALLVLGVVLLVQQLEGNLLEPLIMSRALALHPAVVLVGVASGGLLGGVGGALLATPLIAVVYRVVLVWREPDEPLPEEQPRELPLKKD
jgi:putative heme transporter